MRSIPLSLVLITAISAVPAVGFAASHAPKPDSMPADSTPADSTSTDSMPTDSPSMKAMMEAMAAGDMAAAIASAEAMPQADRDAMQKMMMTMMGGAHGGMGNMGGMGMMQGMGGHGGMSDQASGGMTGGGMNKMAAGGFTGAGGMMGGNGGGMKAMGMGDHQGKSGMMGLETTGNAEADFMRAMAVHHRSAVEMAQTVLSEDSDPEVRDLAEATIANQGAEITRIEEWLTEQGFAVPE